MRIKLSIATLLVFAFVSTPVLCQKAEWKGTTEIIDGVLHVKNPSEPLYGDISLDLEKNLEIGDEGDEKYTFYRWARIAVDENKNIFVLDAGTGVIKKYDRYGKYIQTIGGEGQGPGEFYDIYEVVLNGAGQIYVRDSWEIEVFDSNGEFLRNYKPKTRISNYCVLESGKILAESFTGKTHDVALLSSDWKKIKTISSFPFDRDLMVRSHYTPSLWVYPMSNRLFLFGYSSEYKLNIVDSSGSIIRVIEKEIESKNLSLTNTEKSKYIDFWMKRREARRPESKLDRSFLEKYMTFPKEKAAFYRLYSDSKNRIYVRQIVEPLIEEMQSIYDLFNEKGYYLHKIKLPFSVGINFLGVIKKGNLYRAEENYETGYIKIVRYKIKNWDQIQN